MENLSIKINLAKLNGAFIKEIAGRTETKKLPRNPYQRRQPLSGTKGNIPRPPCARNEGLPLWRHAHR